MNRKLSNLCMALGVVALNLAGAVSANAQQATEVKAKPPLYTYVASFAFPRSDWGAWDNSLVANDKMMQGAVADGKVLAFGSGSILVHSVGGFTQNDWWCSPSMGSLLGTLDQINKSSSDDAALLGKATAHADQIYISRYYNWKPGTVSNGYVLSAMYKVKPEAPAGSVAMLSKTMIAPLLEKLFADGAISAYQVATQEFHTEDPGTFYVFYLAPKADGLDKVYAALATVQSDEVQMSAFDSLTDSSPHRDSLALATATFK